MDDCHVVVRCKIASLMNRPEGNLFKQVSYTCMAEFVMLQFFLSYSNQIFLLLSS